MRCTKQCRFELFKDNHIVVKRRSIRPPFCLPETYRTCYAMRKRRVIMLGRIAAVVCWVAGVYVLFNIPQLNRRDISSFSAYYSAKESIGMTFYGIAGGCALFGAMLWELGTCAMRLTKIAGKGERKEEPIEK